MNTEETEITEREQIVVDLFRNLSSEDQDDIISYFERLLKSQS